MSAYIVRTDKLCAVCIYLPAEDLPSTDERLTVVDLNDLCSDCMNKDNAHKLCVRPLTEYEKNIQDRVHAASLWLKVNNGYMGISP